MRNKIAVVVVGIALVAGSACKKKSSAPDTVGKMTEFKDAICKCKAADTECAKKVLDDQKKWGDEAAKLTDKDAKLDPDAAAEMAKKLEPINAEYAKCMTAAMTPVAEPKPTEPKPTEPPKADGVKVVDALAKFEPPLPAIAKTDFEWKRESGQDTTVLWRLRKKGAPATDPKDSMKTNIAMIFELSDETARVKQSDFEPYSGDKKYSGLPTKRGSDFIYVQAGNVEVHISAGPSFKEFANDAVMEDVLKGIDFAALSKL